VSAVRLISASAVLGGRPVLDGVDLSVASGELVALCGPNGAGKSSAIRACVGLVPLTAGEAHLAGRSVHGLSARQRAERVAYLPQERAIAWNMPALEIAALGAPFLSGPEALIRARQALEAVGAAALADRGVAEMSGGERARVLLARALVSQAPLLLADEPVAGLDPDAQLLVLEKLKTRSRSGGAVLVSLHDLTLAARWADRVVVMDRGRVVAHGAPLDALTPGVLQSVFGITGGWIDAPSGPLLDAVRSQ
jgi:iron complex transport system ATP-binding protein